MSGIRKERLGEIAVLFILKENEKEGVTFNPSTVKREIHNGAKDLGIDIVEMAECMKVAYLDIYKKTMEEIDNLININLQKKEDQANIS